MCATVKNMNTIAYHLPQHILLLFKRKEEKTRSEFIHSVMELSLSVCVCMYERKSIGFLDDGLDFFLNNNNGKSLMTLSHSKEEKNKLFGCLSPKENRLSSISSPSAFFILDVPHYVRCHRVEFRVTG